MIKFWNFLLYVITYLITSCINAQSLSTIPIIRNGAHAITEYSEIFADTSFKITFDSLRQLPHQYSFKPLRQHDLLEQPLGIAYWLRFRVENRSDVPFLNFVTVFQRSIDAIQLFTVHENGQVEQSPLLGSSIPYELQKHHANVPSFPFKLMPNQTDTFYLYLFQRDMPISTPIALTTGEGIVAIELLYRSGIISGFALAYVLCALGMFWFTKKPLYFAYFVYTLGAFGYFMATQGIGYIWLWSNHFGFETVSEATFGTLMMVGFMLTTIHFFELECSFPNIHKILKTFIAFSLFFIGVGLFRKLFPCGTYYYTSVLGLCVCVMGLCLVFLVAVLSYLRFKRREAFYFLMGFSLFIASVIATILHELGMLEVDNWFFQTLPHLSLFVEFTIFMGILANRLKNEWLTRKQTEWRLQREMQEQSQRISQDLHDEVGSALNSISVFSEVAKYQIQQIQPNVVPILNQIGETARTLSVILNDIVWVVNPKNEQLENIIVKMQLFAADLLMSQHVTIDFQCNINENDVTQLNMEQRKAFYLLFKEAINNVYKHAACSDLKIHIQQVENQICMTIEDNGNGFDLKSSSVGNGLSTMRERAKILKSLLIIQTAVDEGCIMVLSFPIQC